MQKLTASVVVILLISVSASAQEGGRQSSPFSITEARNEAVGFALTTGLVAINATKNCVTLNDASLQNPDQVAAGWRQRNGRYIDASLGYLHYGSALIASKRGKEAGQAFFQSAQLEAQKNAAATLRDLFSSQPPNREKCEKLLGLITAGEMDLKAKPAYMTTLDEILSFHTAVMERARKP